MYESLPKITDIQLSDNEGKRIVAGLVELPSGKKAGPYFIIPEQSTAMHLDGMVMCNSSGRMVHWSRIMDSDPRIIPEEWIY